MTRKLATASLALALTIPASATAAPLPAHHCAFSGGAWLCTGPGDPNHADPPITRLSGPDRYATSAAIAVYEQGTESVLIVAAGNGIDAIAAGTHLDGPLVLVPTGGDTVPQSVLNAAATINPARIIVVGGTGTVTDTQATLIQSYAYSYGTGTD